MKTIYIIYKNMIKIMIVLILMIGLDELGYGFNQNFKVRLLGSIGYTAGGNVNIGDGSLFNYRFSVQPLYWLNRIEGDLDFSIGLDLGYLHAYTTSYKDFHHKDGRSKYGSVSFFHSLVTLDFLLYRSIFGWQFGLGPYFGVGDNTDIAFGLSFGPSLNFSLSESITIPVLMRFDIILDEKTLIPVNVYVGLSYQFF